MPTHTIQSQPKILVVDDEPEACVAIKTFLESEENFVSTSAVCMLVCSAEILMWKANMRRDRFLPSGFLWSLNFEWEISLGNSKIFSSRRIGSRYDGR